MKFLPFDSRDDQYKSIFGAVAAGKCLRLRLLMHRDTHCSAAYLLYRRDDWAQFVRQPMLYEASYNEDFGWWSCTLSFETGLYWYAFEYASDQGTRQIRRFRGGEGYVSDGGSLWQLTCYDPSFQTPAWLGGGVMYQIFPDRFNASGQPKQNVPADRFLQQDKTAQPVFRQADDTERLGNDYYGGDLAGIIQKLPYLHALGVTCLYMNPIFEAHSNHRYNTADYLAVDPMLGNADDLRSLCEKAKGYGIRIILDGVFSHTGEDSRYFNKNGRYPEAGAYQSKESPYYSWFKFHQWPFQYQAWWGIASLPEVREDDPSYDAFINGPDGVIAHWLDQGVSGWRLDVADELPDAFLENLRRTLKSKNPDAYLLGEVWEDASNKISYGRRRRFLLGKQLDSVMNYPLKEAIIAFLRGGDSTDLMETVMSLLEHYPPPAIRVLMNHVGTHDTPRLLTALAGEPAGARSREALANSTLSDAQRQKGLRFVRLAAVLQFTLPGIPCIYYGDEAGMEGYGDPFCRGYFPWQNADDSLTAFYRQLGQLRRAHAVFDTGAFVPVYSGAGHIAYGRESEREAILIGVNRWCDPEPITVDPVWEQADVLFGARPARGEWMLPAEGFSILYRKKHP